jgi:hypothetical protein
MTQNFVESSQKRICQSNVNVEGDTIFVCRAIMKRMKIIIGSVLKTEGLALRLWLENTN